MAGGRGCFALAAALAAAANTLGPAQGERPCSNSFSVPLKPPDVTTEYNGIQLTDVCLNTAGPHHLYAIGDWGGVLLSVMKEKVLVPADRRSALFPGMGRRFVHGVDDKAQSLVAEQMKRVSEIAPPDYILNLGDMFYWQGVDGTCGGPVVVDHVSDQFTKVFEDVYSGPLASTPFLGILGNHDYGGNRFSSAWQQTIGYTWGGNLPRTQRWILPALYWAQRVRYPDLSVDYLFVDTNVADSKGLCAPGPNQGQGCGNQGPASPELCESWFASLWGTQKMWLVSRLKLSADSTFQIIVAHHPPVAFRDFWSCLADRFGIDLFISGHEHLQRVNAADDPQNPLSSGTCTVISGGGGGITSEYEPQLSGADDMYGFMDVVLHTEAIVVNAISHGGHWRSKTVCPKREANMAAQCGEGHQSFV